MRETRILEFKETITNTFLKTVSAFSNYNGGTILFGVDDDGKPRKISEAEETDVDALQCIYDNLVNFAEEKDVEWED